MDPCIPFQRGYFAYATHHHEPLYFLKTPLKEKAALFVMDEITTAIEQRSTSFYHVALVVHKMFKDTWSYIPGRGWTIIDDDEHTHTDEAAIIKMKGMLTTHVRPAFMERSQYWWKLELARCDNEQERRMATPSIFKRILSKTKHPPPPPPYQENRELEGNASSAGNIALQLLNSPYKSQIIAECEYIFMPVSPGFDDILSVSQAFIDSSIRNGHISHVNVAAIVFDMFGEFLFYVPGQGWTSKTSHDTDEAIVMNLKRILHHRIYDAFIERANIIQSTSTSKAASAAEIAKHLRTDEYKNYVIQECQQFFMR